MISYDYYIQAGNSPCTGGNGKSSSNTGDGSGKNRSILGSCIARTSSEEELQDPSKRPISPGHRGTTWNGKNINLTITIGFIKRIANSLSLIQVNLYSISEE